MKRVLSIAAVLMLVILSAACQKKDIEALDERITQLENSQIKTVADLKAAVNASISDLQGMDQTLKGQIEDLSAAKDALDRTCLGLNHKIDSLNRAMTDADADLRETLDDLTHAFAGYQANFQEAMEAINGTLASLTQKDEAILTAIGQLKELLDGELAAERDRADASYASLQSFRQLSEKVDSLAAEMSKLDVSGIYKRLDDWAAQLSGFEGQFEAILASLKDLEARITELLGQIRSISFVPDFSDGRVAVHFLQGEDLTSRSEVATFKVSPASAITRIKEFYEKTEDMEHLSFLQAAAVKTQTRAEASFIPLPISLATFDLEQGLMYVTLDCSPIGVDFPANAVVQVTDGTTEISSDYVPLFSADYIIRYATSDERAVVPFTFKDKVLYNQYAGKNGGTIIFDSSYDPADVTMYQGPFSRTNLISVDIQDPGFLCDGCFEACQDLAIVTLPEGQKTIPPLAFNNCPKLRQINLPESLTEIGLQAFRDCRALTVKKFPGSLRAIRDYAFSDCTGLEGELTLPGVETIGSRAFFNCPGLTKVTGNFVETIGSEAFSCDDGITAIYFSHLQHMGIGAFSKCSALRYVSVGVNLTVLPKSAFAQCTGLINIVIPTSVKSIESKAFYGCTGIKDLMFEASDRALDKIGASAFAGCSIGQLTLNATAIDEYAFEGNPVAELKLGSRTAWIGDGAFAQDNCQTTVEIEARTPPQIGAGVWTDKTLVSITTPDPETYKKAAGWSVYADKIK